MFDRVMAAAVGLGICALAIWLLLNRYTAPGCGADVATSQLIPELEAKTGLSGLYLLNTRSTGGDLLAGRRQCVVDVAQIKALQPLAEAHWLKVMYSTSIDRTTGVVTVQSRVAGPVTPVFDTAPKT